MLRQTNAKLQIQNNWLAKRKRCRTAETEPTAKATPVRHAHDHFNSKSRVHLRQYIPRYKVINSFSLPVRIYSVFVNCMLYFHTYELSKYIYVSLVRMQLNNLVKKRCRKLQTRLSDMQIKSFKTKRYS